MNFQKLAKRAVAIALTAVTVSPFCASVVLAANGGRHKGILSFGKIESETGNVLIDSQDLIYLADEVDDLEVAYKAGLLEKLNALGVNTKCYYG